MAGQAGAVAGGSGSSGGGSDRDAGTAGSSAAVGGSSGNTNGGSDSLSGMGGAAGVGNVAGAPGPTDGGLPCHCSAPTPSCVAGVCVSRGPAMVKVTTFYIDKTEVTVADYQAFQAAKAGDTSGQPSDCAWNSSYEPAYDPTLAASATATTPITNIDYCDAAAFCAWADKKLCGRIGGGVLAVSDLPFANRSEWFAACAGPQGQQYPYGSSYQSGFCNDASGPGKLTQVGAKTACTGYYPGLVDMVGNAQEWVAACDNNGCERIGGSYLDNNAGCSKSGQAVRSLQARELGFRCCSQDSPTTRVSVGHSIGVPPK